ncbi:MAG TPA: MlaD family protein, partial [Thermoanaerobaculia bacterium]
MSSAAKVGGFMLVILAVLGYFVLKIERVSVGGGPTKKVTAVFDSVAGLDNKSKVRVAGVPVGEVRDIRLRPDGKAEVTMDINRDVQLHRGAFARVVNLGLLGEKYIELVPGPVNEPQIPEQQVLRGTQPASIDEVTNQISAIATDVKAITESLRGVMTGPQGEQRLQEVVENIREITAQVRDLVATNRTNVDATLANTREITAQLRTEIPRVADAIEKVANSLSGTLGENRQEIRGVVENLRKLSGDLRSTTDNLNAITGQVRSGEGTVGKLLYSEE